MNKKLADRAALVIFLLVCATALVIAGLGAAYAIKLLWLAVFS